MLRSTKPFTRDTYWEKLFFFTSGWIDENRNVEWLLNRYMEPYYILIVTHIAHVDIPMTTNCQYVVQLQLVWGIFCLGNKTNEDRRKDSREKYKSVIKQSEMWGGRGMRDRRADGGRRDDISLVFTPSFFYVGYSQYITHKGWQQVGLSLL